MFSVETLAFEGCHNVPLGPPKFYFEFIDLIYFLVPAQYGTEKVSLPGALFTWCCKFLPEDHVKVKYNIMRKLFHKALRAVTADEDQLKELMVILDAHSKEVQDTHYILRDPEDDVILAKKMVELVLGGTKPWPTEEQVREYLAEQGDIAEGGPPHAPDEAESSDEELEYFDGGKTFGIQKPEPIQSLAELFSLPKDFLNPKKQLLALVDGDAGESKNKPAPRDVAAAKKEYYDKYQPPETCGLFHQKTKLDPCAHTKIESATREEQQRAGLPDGTLPSKDFFWDLRCQLIDEKLLSKYNCWDVCRSHMKNLLNKAKCHVKEHGKGEDVD